MRLSKETIQHTPWYLKPFFWHQQRKYGQILEPARVWAQMPRLFVALLSMVGTLNRKKSPLPPALRALVSIRVSQLNWCRFCVDLNEAIYLKHEAIKQKYEQLENWKHSEWFSATEKAALDYCEQMTTAGNPVTENCFNTLKTHFSEQQILELTALIAMQNMSSKFNSALDLPPQGICRTGGKNTGK